MGMDVYGRKPTSEEGNYFRRSVWGWRPLADLCVTLAPEICSACEHWQSNDGDGLDDKASKRLADLLAQSLSNGAIKAFVELRNATIAQLPNQICNLCEGTGIRTDEMGAQCGHPERVIDEPGHPRHGEKGWCNGCDGRGSKPHWETNYDVDEDDVREFVAFLKDCGGFEIC